MPGLVYEVTTRTVQERFLIRPGREARDLVLGTLGRALAMYPSVMLHAFAFLSNHAHLLVSATDGHQLSDFVGYVNGNVARELGRLHRWSGPFWSRRARMIPILDDDAVIDRLRYVLAQGVKEGLVASPRDWPGASAVPALVDGKRLRGKWINRDMETRARRRARPADPATYTEWYDVVLTPIPPWAGLSPAELARRHRAIVHDVERQHRGRSILGANALRRVDPHDRPKTPTRRPAPACHTTEPVLRRAYRSAYRAFVEAFRHATGAVRKTLSRTWGSLFPPGSHPRPRTFVAGQPGIGAPNLAGLVVAPATAPPVPKTG